MAAEKDVSLEDFYSKYTRTKGRGRRKYFELREVKSSSGMDCIFLDRQQVPGKAVCSLYDARPTQCKSWPFWPELLESEDSWKNAKSGCPGIGKGTLYSQALIEGELRR